MRPAHAAAIILAIALTLIASFSVQNTAAAQTDCLQALTAAGHRRLMDRRLPIHKPRQRLRPLLHIHAHPAG